MKKILLTICFLLIATSGWCANRFWVGGSDTWDGTAGTKWALTSGGTGGAAVPTPSDDVYFDSGSGAVTVTTSGTTTDYANNISFSGFTGILSHDAATTINIYGNATWVSGMTYTLGSATTSAIIFASTATGKTFTSGTKTFGNLTFDGVGGGWTLQDNLTSTGALDLTAGTLVMGNHTHSALAFVSSNSNTRTLDIQNTTFNATSGVNTYYGWNITTATNFTLVNNSSTIINLARQTAGVYFAGGGQTYLGSVNYTGNLGIYILDANTFNNFSFDAAGSSWPYLQFGLSADQTITGTLTLKGGLDNRYRLLVLSNILGAQKIITNTGATVVGQRADFQDIGFSSPVDLSTYVLFPGGAGDGGNNTNISFPSPRTLYYKLQGGGTTPYHSAYNARTWYTGSGGTGTQLDALDSPLLQDTAYYNASSDVLWNYGPDIDQNRVGTLSFEGIPTHALYDPANNNIYIYGSYYGSASSAGDNYAFLNFMGRGTSYYKSNGYGVSCIIVNAYSGTVQLLDTGYVSTWSNVFTVQSGTFNDGNYDVYFGRLSIARGTVIGGTGTWTSINDQGTFRIYITGGNVNFSTTNFNILYGTPGECYFFLNGVTFNNFTLSTATSGADFYSFWDSFGINGVLTFPAPSNIKVAAGITITMGASSSISAAGSSGNLISIDARFGDGTWTITRPSGTQTFSLDWLTLNRSVATQANTFYAGANTTNTGTNTNWVFSAPPSLGGKPLIMFSD